VQGQAVRLHGSLFLRLSGDPGRPLRVEGLDGLLVGGFTLAASVLAGSNMFTRPTGHIRLLDVDHHIDEWLFVIFVDDCQEAIGFNA